MALFFFLFPLSFLIFTPVPFEVPDIFCCPAAFPADWLSLCQWRLMIGREPLGASPYPRFSLNSLSQLSQSLFLSFFPPSLHWPSTLHGFWIQCCVSQIPTVYFLPDPTPFDNPDNAAAVVDAGMNAQPDGQAMGDEHSES